EVIINNAGIARDGLFMWMSPDDWSSVLQVSLQGFYNVTNFFIQKLLRQRFGRIINIVSVSGVKGTRSEEHTSELQSRENLVCRLSRYTLFPYTTLFRSEVIINNAGIARDGLFMWMSPDDWSSVLQVSLQGFYNVTNFFIQKLLRQRFGRIINIVSVSGVKGT